MAYSKTDWKDNDVITKEKMNNLEAGVETANNGIPAAATTATAGLVKQAAFHYLHYGKMAYYSVWYDRCLLILYYPSFSWQ